MAPRPLAGLGCLREAWGTHLDVTNYSFLSHFPVQIYDNLSLDPPQEFQKNLSVYFDSFVSKKFIINK